MTKEELLLKTADLIEKEGWHAGQKDGEERKPGYSIEEAMSVLTTGQFSRDWEEGEHIEAFDLATEAAGQVSSYLGLEQFLHSGHGWVELWDWQDHEDRTQAEVVEALRGAAANT
jgi:hypothetical protein